MGGELVVLEPLEHRHGQELAEAVRDGELHTLWYANLPSPEGMSCRPTGQIFGLVGRDLASWIKP